MQLLTVVLGLPGTIGFATGLAHLRAPTLWGKQGMVYWKRYYRLGSYTRQLRFDNPDRFFRGQPPRHCIVMVSQTSKISPHPFATVPCVGFDRTQSHA